MTPPPSTARFGTAHLPPGGRGRFAVLISSAAASWPSSAGAKFASISPASRPRPCVLLILRDHQARKADFQAVD
jgi:hypothetical protein